MARAKKEVDAEAKPRGRQQNPDSQNGVAPPAAGTASAAVWAACDKLAAKSETGTPSPKAVIEEVQKKNPDVNVSTAKTQIARWRQYHGMVTPRG
jgi:hypothetical protein